MFPGAGPGLPPALRAGPPDSPRAAPPLAEAAVGVSPQELLPKVPAGGS